MITEQDSRPIVVGFDPQTLDRAPVEFAAAAARLTGSPLIVVSACAEAPIADSLPPGYGDEQLAMVGQQAIVSLKTGLDPQGVSVEFREVRGASAARVLYELAEQSGASLLVVGSTQRGAVGRVLPGSTAERLLHSAPCAVAVVPHAWRAGGLETIGVAYVESDEGVAALRAAHALAEREQALLRVLSIVKPRPGGLDAQGRRQTALEAKMREAVTQLPGLVSDVEIQIDAFSGNPADTLIGVSEHLDLLVCGSRGYGPLRAALMGGVTRSVTAAAACPVIVLARGVEAPLESEAASMVGA